MGRKSKVKDSQSVKRQKPHLKFKSTYCIACGHNGSFYPLDVDHIKTRGAGGKDEKENCWTLCRACHTLKGQKGLNHMAEAFMSCHLWLTSNGWEFDEFLQKWTRPLL